MEIDLHSDVPSYIQLADQLRQGISDGKWRPREPIPSITDLVGETGLAVGTVRKAVRLLVDEGLVYIVSGRGTFVTPPEDRAELPPVCGGNC